MFFFMQTHLRIEKLTIVLTEDSNFKLPQTQCEHLQLFQGASEFCLEVIYFPYQKAGNSSKNTMALQRILKFSDLYCTFF